MDTQKLNQAVKIIKHVSQEDHAVIILLMKLSKEDAMRL